MEHATSFSNKQVYEMANKVFPLVSFIDHEGIFRSFRKFSRYGCEGVSDVRANRMILPDHFKKVEISSYYEAFIVRAISKKNIEDTSIPWRLQLFSDDIEDFSNRITDNPFKKLVQGMCRNIIKAINSINGRIAKKSDTVWQAFELDGSPLFNGEYFSYSEILKHLEDRSKDWTNWCPDTNIYPTGHDWRAFVKDSN